MAKCKWYLSITKDEFDELYPDLIDIKWIFENEPNDDEDMIKNYLPVKLWRMNNLYWIENKDGVRMIMNMNRGQHKVKAAQRKHPRVIVLKSRQQGISTYWLLDYYDDALFMDALNIGMLAQGLEEAATLLTRVKTAWDLLDPGIKAFLGVAVTKDNSKEFSFNNDCTIFIRSSFRSTTLQRLHVSELGKISAKDPQKARELVAGTMQAIKAGNPVVLESTAEGRKNLFHKLWYGAVNFVGERALKDFYPVFLSWVDDPDCTARIPQRLSLEDEEYINLVERDLDIALTNEQKWWVATQRRESGTDFDQEYPYSPEAAFAAVRDGAYFAKIWKESGRLWYPQDEGIEGKGIVLGAPGQHTLYDGALDTFVSMDLGMNDMMVLIVWQEHTNISGQIEIRIVRVYKNSGESLEHYYRWLVSLNIKIANVYLPHDAKVRELGSGKSRVGILRDLGMRNTRVLKKTNNKNNDIELARRMLPSVIIDMSAGSGCDYLDDMMHNYSKEWDEKGGMWKNKPLHDEWSNPADAFLYLVMSRYASGGTSGKPEKVRKKRKSRGLAL